MQCCVRQFISPGGKKHQIWELFVGIKIRWWQLTKLRHIIMRWNKLCRKFLKVRLNHNPIDTPLILPKKEWTNERMNEQTNEQTTNKRMNERTNERMNLGFFLLLYSSREKTQIRSFVFWENLRHTIWHNWIIWPLALGFVWNLECSFRIVFIPLCISIS